MMKLKQTIIQSLKQILYGMRKVPTRFVHKEVPYFSQWETPGLNKQILEKTISTNEDPNWRLSGAKTKQEYHDWSWSGCGMACTKMLLAYQTGKASPLVHLGKKCAEYGGYTLPLKDAVGLLYKPYLRFIANEFGWQGRIAVGTPLQQIKYELADGNFFIASVSPKIRDLNDTPKVKGGHLVLLFGYDDTKQAFYLHNPSGNSKKSQANAEVAYEDFKKFFSGRGIVVRATK